MSAQLPTKTKDQGGVSASSEWLRERGHGTYGPRQRGKAQAGRTSRPITWEHYEALMETRSCPDCNGVLGLCAGPAGGKFLGCTRKDCGYYAGWEAAVGEGHERVY